MKHPTLLLSAFSVAACVAEVPPPPLPALPPLPATAAPTAQPNASAAAAGPTCREFRQTITIGGEAKEGFGLTCLQPDGTWRIENGPGVGPPPETSLTAPPPAPPPPPPPVLAAPVYPYPYYYPGWAYAPPFYGSVFIGGRWR